ncbi:hypothetical protein NIES4071_64520 [Calothrix sp. NIES-4071]|nr:hypothetical protein NIES4071_64520 [Calothrix sp. NIES-4071]BAZ60756.1 hypothetical protein NIES4105_64480 [Calothrix sp. NIES-4105]
MTADVFKQNTLLEAAYKHLNQLSYEKLQLAVALLSHLQVASEDELSKLLNIPGFAAALHKTENQELENSNSTQIADSEEVWEAYLEIEKQWEEVFYRLADS